MKARQCSQQNQISRNKGLRLRLNPLDPHLITLTLLLYYLIKREKAVLVVVAVAAVTLALAVAVGGAPSKKEEGRDSSGSSQQQEKSTKGKGSTSGGRQRGVTVLQEQFDAQLSCPVPNGSLAAIADGANKLPMLVAPVERFLDRANNGKTRSYRRPGRSPKHYDFSPRNSLHVVGQIRGCRVNLKPEKKSEFSSVVLKQRGIDEEKLLQNVTGGKLREIIEAAKSFDVGNKALAALCVHTPAGEMQRQIRSWLAENFEFLSVGADDPIGGTTDQPELLSTAIMDGWMAGLGAAQPPSTYALGRLLSEYAKRDLSYSI